MSRTIYPLVSPSDYVELNDGSYTLPPKDDYLLIDGAFCDNPEEGAFNYNKALLHYIRRISKNDYGELRYRRIFYKYKNNRRIRRVIDVVTAIQKGDRTAQTELHGRANQGSTFTSLESILFLHLPIEYLES